MTEIQCFTCDAQAADCRSCRFYPLLVQLRRPDVSLPRVLAAYEQFGLDGLTETWYDSLRRPEKKDKRP